MIKFLRIEIKNTDLTPLLNRAAGCASANILGSHWNDNVLGMLSSDAFGYGT